MNTKWCWHHSLLTTFVPEKVYQAQASAHGFLSLVCFFLQDSCTVFGCKLPCQVVKGVLGVLWSTSQGTIRALGLVCTSEPCSHSVPTDYGTFLMIQLPQLFMGSQKLPFMGLAVSPLSSSQNSQRYLLPLDGGIWLYCACCGASIREKLPLKWAGCLGQSYSDRILSLFWHRHRRWPSS